MTHLFPDFLGSRFPKCLSNFLFSWRPYSKRNNLTPPFIKYLGPNNLITVCLNNLVTVNGHLTILGVYASTEGRYELNEEFYETLQKILDKVNKNDYIIFMEDMNDRVGNNIFCNIAGTNAEDTLNSNGRTLI